MSHLLGRASPLVSRFVLSLLELMAPRLTKVVTPSPGSSHRQAPSPDNMEIIKFEVRTMPEYTRDASCPVSHSLHSIQ